MYFTCILHNVSPNTQGLKIHLNGNLPSSHRSGSMEKRSLPYQGSANVTAVNSYSCFLLDDLTIDPIFSKTLLTKLSHFA
jgi:hypothetical protein